MPQTIFPMAFALVAISVSLVVQVFSNQRMLRAERRRSGERAEVDRRLIEAQAGRADAAEELARIRKDTIGLLEDRLAAFEGNRGSFA